MANNLTTPVPNGTNVATEEIAAIHHSINKMRFGSAGTSLNIEDNTPLPTKAMPTENNLGKVGGHSAISTTTITRPADTLAYASGDLVSFSTVAATINTTPTLSDIARVNNGTGSIVRARLSTNKTGLLGSEAFRIHMFRSSPSVVNGDNGPLSVNGVASDFIGSFDVTLDKIFNDGAKGISTGQDVMFQTLSAQTTIYILLEAKSTYTPNSAEQFKISLEVLRD